MTIYGKLFVIFQEMIYPINLIVIKQMNLELYQKQ